MTETKENLIPEANTAGEINTHLSYLRKDIADLKQDNKEQFKVIADQIKDLDDHYITEQEFRPIANAVKENTIQIKLLTEWKDTFTGKMIGFGVAISIASSFMAFLLNHFYK